MFKLGLVLKSGLMYILSLAERTVFLLGSASRNSSTNNCDTRVDSLHVGATFHIELGFGNLLLYRYFFISFFALFKARRQVRAFCILGVTVCKTVEANQDCLL
jgi:hypothetical protein